MSESSSSVPLDRPAIVVVGYKRVDSLERLLDSLSRAIYPSGGVPLIISLDRSPTTRELVSVAEGFEWPFGDKVIRSFQVRQGLRDHVLSCGDLTLDYPGVILLEDDLVVGPGFYNFAIQAMFEYGEDTRVAGVSLYRHSVNEYANEPFSPLRRGDVFFAQFSCTWGQCWTAQQWRAFRTWYDVHDGPLSQEHDVPRAVTSWPSTSWARYFVHYMVDQGKYYAIPYTSFSTNTGQVGQHNASPSNVFEVPLDYGGGILVFPAFEEAFRYDAHFCLSGLARDLKHCLHQQSTRKVALLRRTPAALAPSK